MNGECLKESLTWKFTINSSQLTPLHAAMTLSSEHQINATAEFIGIKQDSPLSFLCTRLRYRDCQGTCTRATARAHHNNHPCQR